MNAANDPPPPSFTRNLASQCLDASVAFPIAKPSLRTTASAVHAWKRQSSEAIFIYGENRIPIDPRQSPTWQVLLFEHGLSPMYGSISDLSAPPGEPMTRTILALLGLSVVLGSPVAAEMDLHAFWDGRCKECHGHAGDFARRHLKAMNGQLVGRHHVADLKRFMGQHEMGREHVEAIHDMLLAQASTLPLFQQKCAGCHQTAAEFARSSLALREGVVVGRGNQLPVAEFLKRHGKLAADEIPIVVQSLTRVLRETGAGTSK